jgi:pantetheine-phosphate adenylyltransferase
MTAGAAARLAIYPGSFDPVTNGHVDVIRRASRLFDRVVVAVLVNAEKQPLFSTAERVEMIRAAIGDDSTIDVETFDGLLVDYAERRGAAAIIRGLRAIADFEYELQMALMNRRLNQRVETVFLMPSEAYIYTSSRLVKEVFMLGGSVHGLVPPMVEARLDGKRRHR